MSGGMIVIRQNRLMEAFEDAGATAPERARSLEQLGCRDSFIFRRMVARDVFQSTGDDRWWMDMDATAAFVHRRHLMILSLLLLALATVVFVLIDV